MAQKSQREVQVLPLTVQEAAGPLATYSTLGGSCIVVCKTSKTSMLDVDGDCQTHWCSEFRELVEDGAGLLPCSSWNFTFANSQAGPQVYSLFYFF